LRERVVGDRNAWPQIAEQFVACQKTPGPSFISWPESVEDESEAFYFVNFVFFVVEIVLIGIWDLGFGIYRG